MWIIALENLLLREDTGGLSMDHDKWALILRAACPAHGAVVIGRVIASALPLRCVNELARVVIHFEGGRGMDDVVEGVTRALEESPAAPLKLAVVVERLRGLAALPDQLNIWQYALARCSRRILKVATSLSHRHDDSAGDATASTEADQAFSLLESSAGSLSLGMELVPLLRDLVIEYFASMDKSHAAATTADAGATSRRWSTLRRLRLAISCIVKVHEPAAALFTSELLLDAIHSPASAVGRVIGYGSAPPLSVDSSLAPTNMPLSLQLAPPFGEPAFPVDVEIGSNRAHLFSLVTSLVRNCPNFSQAHRRCLVDRVVSKVALAHQLQAAQPTANMVGAASSALSASLSAPAQGSASLVPNSTSSSNTPTSSSFSSSPSFLPSSSLTALHKAYQLPRRPSGELDTIVYREFLHNPAMWELLLPLAESPREFAECRSIILILLAHLVSSWHTDVSEGSERLALETSRLLLSLSTAGFLPPPLDRVSLMLPVATRAETAKILLVCWECLAEYSIEAAENYQPQNDISVESYVKRVRLIVEASIERLGSFFADFIK